jgi:hypothetical protein
LAEAHFWLAEGLRQSGNFTDAAGEYAEYLRTSDFDTGFMGQVSFWLRGFTIGGGERAGNSREDVWE